MPPAPQPTASALEAPAPSAEAPPVYPAPVEGALPAWVDPYLASLRSCLHKPDAARAVGVDLSTIADLRDTHPAFAAQERRTMSAYADLLEAEALRRVTTLPTPGPDGKFLRPLGSDRLLLRLMEHYLPGFAPAKKTAASSSPSRQPSPAKPGPANSTSPSAATTPPGELAALRKQIDLLNRENSNLQFHKQQLEKKIAKEVAYSQRASRVKLDFYARSKDLEDALAAAGLPLPPYRTPIKPDDYLAAAVRTAVPTCASEIDTASAPTSAPTSHSASASTSAAPTSAPSPPADPSPASPFYKLCDLLSAICDKTPAPPVSPEPAASATPLSTKILPSPASSSLSQVTPPPAAPIGRISPIGPIGPITPHAPLPSTPSPSSEPSAEFIARELAKLHYERALLTAEHRRFQYAGVRPTHRPFTENRARFRLLESLDAPIITGLTFEQALAQATDPTDPTLRPP